MAVAVNIVTGDFPDFEAAASASATTSVLTTLLPYVGADLVTQISALSAGDLDQMLAELVQSVRVLGIP